MVLDDKVTIERLSLATDGGLIGESRMSMINDVDAQGCSIDGQLEDILVWSQQRFGNEELVQAKEEFFWKTGKVFHDDPFYEQRMNYFLDYFLLERPISNKFTIAGASRFPTDFLREEIRVKPTGVKPWGGIATHSIFEVVKHVGDKILIDDLQSGRRVEVSPRINESFRLLVKKQLLQGFLYEEGGKAYLSRGILFHPVQVSRLIKKELKQGRKNPEFNLHRTLSTRAKQHLRYLRYPNLEPKRIYSET